MSKKANKQLNFMDREEYASFLRDSYRAAFDAEEQESPYRAWLWDKYMFWARMALQAWEDKHFGKKVN